MNTLGNFAIYCIDKYSLNILNYLLHRFQGYMKSGYLLFKEMTLTELIYMYFNIFIKINHTEY